MPWNVPALWSRYIQMVCIFDFVTVYCRTHLCHDFCLQLGFDSVHFARIDYQDRQKRKVDKSLEVIWRGSKTFGSSSQVLNFFFFLLVLSKCIPFFFWHAQLKLQIFANTFPVHYSPPEGFGFEVDDDILPVQVWIFSERDLKSTAYFHWSDYKFAGWWTTLWLQCWTTC